MNIATLTMTFAVLLLVSGCGPSQEKKVQTPRANIRFVEQGYHQKAERIDFADILRSNPLADLPAKLPKDSALTVGAIWEHLNRRLKESGVKAEVVIETNMHELKADQLYLQAPITKVFGHELQGDALRTALATASCDDLLSIIGENTKLQTLHRKNEIILSNYVSTE